MYLNFGILKHVWLVGVICVFSQFIVVIREQSVNTINIVVWWIWAILVQVNQRLVGEVGGVFPKKSSWGQVVTEWVSVDPRHMWPICTLLKWSVWLHTVHIWFPLATQWKQTQFASNHTWSTTGCDDLPRHSVTTCPIIVTTCPIIWSSEGNCLIFWLNWCLINLILQLRWNNYR